METQMIQRNGAFYRSGCCYCYERELHTRHLQETQEGYSEYLASKP